MSCRRSDAARSAGARSGGETGRTARAQAFSTSVIFVSSGKPGGRPKRRAGSSAVSSRSGRWLEAWEGRAKECSSLPAASACRFRSVTANRQRYYRDKICPRDRRCRVITMSRSWRGTVQACPNFNSRHIIGYFEPLASYSAARSAMQQFSQPLRHRIRRKERACARAAPPSPQLFNAWANLVV